MAGQMLSCVGGGVSLGAEHKHRGWALLAWGCARAWQGNQQPERHRSNGKVPETARGNALGTANKGHQGQREGGLFQNCLFCLFSGLNVKIQNSRSCSSVGLGSKTYQPAKKNP